MTQIDLNYSRWLKWFKKTLKDIEWCKITQMTELTYTVFKSNWLFVNLYNLETTGKKSSNFQCMLIICCGFTMPIWILSDWLLEVSIIYKKTTTFEVNSILCLKKLFLSTCHFKRNDLGSRDWSQMTKMTDILFHR